MAVDVGVAVGCATAVAVISATTVARTSGVTVGVAVQTAKLGGAGGPPHAADTSVRATVKTIVVATPDSFIRVPNLLLRIIVHIQARQAPYALSAHPPPTEIT